MPTQPRKPPIGRFYELQQEVSVPEPYVLTSKISIPAPTRDQMVALRNCSVESDEADRAVLGEHADAVFELYANRPVQEWEAFTSDLYKHFFGKGVDDVEGKSEPSST
jgi:hypothetical protein